MALAYRNLMMVSQLAMLRAKLGSAQNIVVVFLSLMLLFKERIPWHRLKI